MIKKISALFILAFFALSCGDNSVGVEPVKPDIVLDLPNEFNMLIYRDAINHNYKLSFSTKKLYDQDYNFELNSNTTVDKNDITVKLNEVRGYKRTTPLDAPKEATLFLNLGYLEKGDYSFTVEHPALGNYTSTIKITDELLKFEEIGNPGYINLRYDTVRFITGKVFWGTITYTEENPVDIEEFNADLLANGAKEISLEEGFYSYFNVDDKAEINPKTYTNSQGINYNYYFEYTDLDKVKQVMSNYKPIAKKIINFTAEGEVFPDVISGKQ